MRTEERWPKIQESFCAQHFPPRLRQDILDLGLVFTYNERSPSQYIYGPVGTGKTVIAAFSAIYWYKDLWLKGENGGKVFKFLSYPNLSYELKRTFNDSKTSEFDVLATYMNADLLVLDDIGAGHKTGSDWALGLLYVLINHRYEHMKQTIITSNYSLDELVDVLGDERIPSRIQRMGKVFEKEATWKINS